MDLQLKGKRALISGSSSGLGAECARTLAREGVSVVVTGRDRARAEAVAKEITDAGGKAAVTIGDLQSDQEAYRVAWRDRGSGPVDPRCRREGAAAAAGFRAFIMAD